MLKDFWEIFKSVWCAGWHTSYLERRRELDGFDDEPYSGYYCTKCKEFRYYVDS